MRSRIQAVDMNFLQQMDGFSRSDRVMSSANWEELRVKLLQIEWSQLRVRCFGQPCAIGRRSRRRPRTCWRDYVSWLTWECLHVSLDKMEEVTRGRSWLSCFSGCPLDLTSDKRKNMDGFTVLLF